MDLKKMTQLEKIRFFLAIGILVSFFLPWWSTTYNSNISALGQSFGSSGNISIKGYQMEMSIFGIIASIGAIYFIIQKQIYSFWCALACFLFALNTYFSIQNKLNVSFDYGDLGGASIKFGYQFGFYIFCIFSLILFLFDAKKYLAIIAENRSSNTTENNITPQNTHLENSQNTERLSMPKIAPIKISKFQLMIITFLLLIAGGSYGYWNYIRVPEYTAWDLVELQENNPKELENLKNRKIRISNAYFEYYTITSADDAAKYTEFKPFAATSLLVPFKIIENDTIVSANYFSPIPKPANKIKESHTFLNIRFDEIPSEKINSIVNFDKLNVSLLPSDYEYETVPKLKENQYFRSEVIVEGYIEEILENTKMVNGSRINLGARINFRSTKIIAIKEVNSKIRNEVEKDFSIPFDFVKVINDKYFSSKKDWTFNEILKPIVKSKLNNVATNLQKEEQIAGVDVDTLVPNIDETLPVEEPIVQKHIGIANSEKVYFYTEPDLLTVRKAFIIKGQEVQIIEKIENFYKVSFTNQNAKITEGYMKVSDLVSRT